MTARPTQGTSTQMVLFNSPCSKTKEEENIVRHTPVVHNEGSCLSARGSDPETRTHPCLPSQKKAHRHTSNKPPFLLEDLQKTIEKNRPPLQARYVAHLFVLLAVPQSLSSMLNVLSSPPENQASSSQVPARLPQFAMRPMPFHLTEG